MDVKQWLLEGEPWVVYRTHVDLMGQDPQSPTVRAAYSEMVKHEQILILLGELAGWPGETLKNHKKAGHLLHKLVFVSDIGLRPDHPQMVTILDKVKANAAKEGPFQILVNLPKHFGGSGEDELSWMLCDAGSTLYALASMGGIEDLNVIQAADYLAGLVRKPGGWPCAAAASLGGFRGPGKKDDPCPYANLLMVKALLPFGGRYKREIYLGVQTLFDLWEKRCEVKPYLFAMGSGFEKLKAPLVWYDILHVLEVLSQIPDVRDELVVQEMVKIVRTKADSNGRYQPESVWMDWRGWDFGQKSEPSHWLTFLVLRMLKRFEDG